MRSADMLTVIALASTITWDIFKVFTLDFVPVTFPNYPNL